MQNSHLIQALATERITEIHKSASGGRLARHAAQSARNRRSGARRAGRRGVQAIVLALVATGALAFGATALATVRTDGLRRHPSIARMHRQVRVDGFRRMRRQASGVTLRRGSHVRLRRSFHR